METRVDIEKLTESKSNGSNVELRVLYINVSKFSPQVQFCICCGGVFSLYLIYGYLQELIFTLEGFKPYGWYLTLVQFGYYSIFGYTEQLICGKTVRRIPLQTYALLALLTLGTMGFSNSSLSYLNYPTQVIFKCCKLIPVMVGSILIQNKRYKLLDFAAALLMCVGLSLFTLADSRISPNFSLVGVVMISFALLCDAVIGNVQEKYMKAHGATNREVVLYSYAIGFLYLFVIMFVTGDLWDGIAYCIKMPQAYGYALLFSLSGYLGIQVVLTLVSTCGALAAVTVTTCRKAVSILISFTFFSKPFTVQYLWAGCLVLMGIYLNVLSKNNRSIQFSRTKLMASLKTFLGSRTAIKSQETTV